MSGFVLSGRIVDLVLVFTAAEALIVLLYRRRTGRGPAAGGFLANLAAGVCLLLALRVALAHGWWGWVPLALVGSLTAHLVQLRARY